VVETLVASMQRAPADPVVVMVGDHSRLVPLFQQLPTLADCFLEGWDLAEYSVDELAALAVRELVRRGHEVPDEVRAGMAERLAESADRETVHPAHQLARRLARIAASRTLAVADLPAHTVVNGTPLEQGFASVG
jgi:hypothetical protein